MNEIKETNPKDSAGTNRLDMTLFPDTAAMYGALAMTEGDDKYGAFNYRVAGVRASVYVAACKRHLAKWYNGEDVDSKSLVPHLANAIACIAVLIDAIECDKLTDDRPPRVKGIGKLFERFEEVTEHLGKVYPNGPDRYTALKTPEVL